MKRRTLIQSGSVYLLLTQAHLAHGAEIVAVRVWPATDYTRVTVESDVALVATQTFVTDPPRLAVDITGITLNAELKELVARVKSDDPFISGVRVAQYLPNVVRLVIDLKQPTKPQMFQLAPVPASYQHRLVMDLYPALAVDPLDALIKSTQKDDPLGDWLKNRKPETKLPVPAPSAASPPPIPTPTGKPKSDRLIIVVLDPGHGGEDPGAIGPAGTREKDVVLQIAQLLQARINATTLTSKGYTVRAVLTRDSDFFVPLHERVKKARTLQADLFVSVHADAFFTPTAAGASVFALSEKGASSAGARWIADKENKADAVGGLNIKTRDVQVKSALLDMSTTAQIKDSLHLGGAVLSELGGMAKLHKGQVEQAGFAVLKAPDIPSILVETAFISHPDEEVKLKDPAYQEKLADAMVRGITRYFAKNPPLARTRTV